MDQPLVLLPEHTGLPKNKQTNKQMSRHKKRPGFDKKKAT